MHFARQAIDRVNCSFDDFVSIEGLWWFFRFKDEVTALQRQSVFALLV